MPETSASAVLGRAPLFSPRKMVHISMLAFAFLLPYLTWQEAAGCALLALLFNVAILPHLGVDLSPRRPAEDVHPSWVRDSESGIRYPESGGGNIWRGIILYPISVLALVLLYRHDLNVVGAAWAILAWGDGMASVVGGAVGGPGLPWNRAKTWSGFGGFMVAGAAGAYILLRWVSPGIAPAVALKIAVAAALAGAIVESLPIRLDDNATVPLAAGAVVFCLCLVERSALASNLPYLGRRAALAAAVCLLFAFLALRLHTVTRSGAAAGFFLGVAVYMAWGWKSFLVMFAFFVLGSAATRLGYARKAARGVAEARKGARNWRQALANSLPGACFALLVITTHHQGAFLMALIASFAEAAGDTVSSEIGQWLSPQAYLMTTFKPVAVGENGGVSLAGSLAGFAAAVLVVVLGFGLRLCGVAGAVIALAAAVAGNLLDSLLGATIERRGMVGNGIVNFSSSAFAGALALAAALHLRF